MTVEEGNLLIADFNGDSYWVAVVYGYNYHLEANNKEEAEAEYELFKDQFPPDAVVEIKKVHECMYNYLWDDLMPVVDKIESIHDEHHGYFGVHISSNGCSIQGTNLHKAINDLSGYGWVYMSDPNAIFSTKIESTWYNVVEFIKWYNANLNKIQ